MRTSLLFTHLHPYQLKTELIAKFCCSSQEPTLEEAVKIFQTQFPNLDSTALITSAKTTLDWLTKTKIRFISKWDKDYPQRFFKLSNPPVGIYLLGELPKDMKTLAVVGSRKPTRYGIEIVNYFLDDLRGQELQHISGLAYGIDTLAHCKTLDLNIVNFAILGSGLDSIYPQENIPLVQHILQQGGGILTEFAPFLLPTRFSFPWRNRLIAALSDLVWIPQATKKSGTRHTVEAAIECGTKIAVTPGDVFSELSELPNEYLIHSDAYCIRNKKDFSDSLALM